MAGRALGLLEEPLKCNQYNIIIMPSDPNDYRNLLATNDSKRLLAIQDISDFQCRYVVGEVIGHGGYGTVHKCSLLRIESSIIYDDEFAVKIINNSSETGYCFSRMRDIPNEILFWEGIVHENITKLLEVYYDPEEDKWLLVMDYDLNQMDLFDYIDRHGRLSTLKASNIIRQVVNAYKHLLDHKIDHRDLKDENILYNPRTHKVRLIDFGAASNYVPMLPYITSKGTPTYTPPEFFKHGSYCAPDGGVWSIGCLSYILFHGDSPFRSVKDIPKLTSPENLNPKLAKNSLRTDFIKRCLHPDPEKRITLQQMIEHPWLKVKITDQDLGKAA